MKIGIFDSGIGGLSVLHRALKVFPDAEFIYYADKEHVPYGEKTVDEIRGFCGDILRFLVDQGVDAIVIACNTATSVADKAFRMQFPVPIIGMEPAVKVALEQVASDKRVLVIATPVTIAGRKLQALVEAHDHDEQCDLIALPMLVRYAESEDFANPMITEYIADEMKALDLSLEEYIVLGCTHFNYFKPNIRELMPWIHFTDGNAGTIRQLSRKLNELKSYHPGEEGKVSYFFSGREVNEEEYEQIQRYMHRLDAMYEIL